MQTPLSKDYEMEQSQFLVLEPIPLPVKDQMNSVESAIDKMTNSSGFYMGSTPDENDRRY